MPLVADTSLWFTRRRGIAVAICMSGNYLAGAVWPPIMQHFIDSVGWRPTYIGIGVFCLAAMLPLALVLRRRPPRDRHAGAGVSPQRPRAARRRPSVRSGSRPARCRRCCASPGVACCVAMSMPQVHIVAYCGDLGFGAGARRARCSR